MFQTKSLLKIEECIVLFIVDETENGNLFLERIIVEVV